MRIIGSMKAIFGILMRILLCLLTAVVVFWWMHSIESVANKAPAFSALKELNLTIPEGAEVLLGRAELLQPAGARTAELKHVRLRATDDGQLLISRVAELRNLNVEFGGKTEEGSSEQYEISRDLKTVTRLSAGSQILDISVLEGGGISFKVEDGPGSHTSAVVYESGTRTLINGEAADGCYEQGAITEFAAKTNKFSSDSTLKLSKFLEQKGLGRLFQRRGKSTIAILGGGVNCSMHSYALLSMPRANQELEFVVRKNLSDDRLFVAVYRKANLVPISYETWTDGLKTRHHNGRTGIEVVVASKTPLAQPPVTQFTAGRTRYSIEAENAANGAWNVYIRPDRRIALFDDSVCSRPLSSAADTLSPEDCPPPIDSSPNLLPVEASIEIIKQKLPTGFDRLFVATSDGLSSAEILARAVAILLSLLILLAVPGATIWRSNGSMLHGIFLGIVGVSTISLAMLPDIVSIARIFVDIPMASTLMFYALGMLWICATIVVALDSSGGSYLSGFWFVLTAIIALSSISMFSMSLEGANTDWERFFIKHKLVVLDILPLFVISLTIVSPTALKLRIGNDFAGRPSFFSPVFWLLTIVLALFAAWFFLGNQTGLGGSIQPVEAGKFAIVVLLGASLAQWLIRARLLAQAWFGITLIAVVLSALFIVALLFVPAVKSDYSPLIIIASATAITGIIGFTAIGMRIREEEMDDIKDIERIPLSYMPKILDVRLKPTQLIFLLLVFSLIFTAPLIYADARFHEFLALIKNSIEYTIMVLIVIVLAAFMLVRIMRVPRATTIIFLALPLVLIGAWALGRQEIIVMIIAMVFAVIIIFAVALGGRINWTLARIAIAMPVIAIVLAVGLRDLPAKVGLGVQEWSWFDTPDQQIEELERVLGEGRRLPVERLMSWADLRYGRSEDKEETRQLALRDMNFHVLRSRATIANAPCGLSPELTSAPYNIGFIFDHLGRVVSEGLGLSCPKTATVFTEKLSCTPSTLKAPVRPHCVPVVQSDFAATYITARFGISASALLVALQGIFILFVMDVYMRLQSKRSRDPVETGADQALACIALGAGMLFLMQWILAWSNAFGLLPVMGQPMTWLSAGTSHHLFMAIPAALVLLVATRLAGMRTPVLTIRIPPRRRS